MTDTRTNEQDNTVTDRFVGPHRERYHCDFTQCTVDKGWRQYDTSQDASYFGVWVHEGDRRIVTFAEGDETTTECPSPESFKAELASMAAFYGEPPPAFIAIDNDGTRTDYYDTRPTGITTSI